MLIHVGMMHKLMLGDANKGILASRDSKQGNLRSTLDAGMRSCTGVEELPTREIVSIAWGPEPRNHTLKGKLCQRNDNSRAGVSGESMQKPQQYYVHTRLPNCLGSYLAYTKNAQVQI